MNKITEKLMKLNKAKTIKDNNNEKESDRAETQPNLDTPKIEIENNIEYLNKDQTGKPNPNIANSKMRSSFLNKLNKVNESKPVLSPSNQNFLNDKNKIELNKISPNKPKVSFFIQTDLSSIDSTTSYNTNLNSGNASTTKNSNINDKLNMFSNSPLKSSSKVSTWSPVKTDKGTIIVSKGSKDNNDISNGILKKGEINIFQQNMDMNKMPVSQDSEDINTDQLHIQPITINVKEVRPGFKDFLSKINQMTLKPKDDRPSMCKANHNPISFGGNETKFSPRKSGIITENKISPKKSFSEKNTSEFNKISPKKSVIISDNQLNAKKSGLIDENKISPRKSGINWCDNNKISPRKNGINLNSTVEQNKVSPRKSGIGNNTGNLFENKTSPMKNMIAMMQNNSMFSPSKMKEHLNNQITDDVNITVKKQVETKEDFKNKWFLSRINDKNQNNAKQKKSVFQQENPKKEEGRSSNILNLADKLASKFKKPEIEQTPTINIDEIPELNLKEQQCSSPLKVIAMGLKLRLPCQDSTEEENEINLNKARSQITEKVNNNEITDILIEKIDINKTGKLRKKGHKPIFS